MLDFKSKEAVCRAAVSTYHRKAQALVLHPHQFLFLSLLFLFFMEVKLAVLICVSLLVDGVDIFALVCWLYECLLGYS